MATFRAVGRIEHGEVDDEGVSKSVVFEPGDKVEGLSKDSMKQLWDAGALVQEGKDESPSE